MFRQIKYFQAVVRYHSFSEAAEACHISQSAISQQIQALERELGFLLLERKNRSFELTPAGEFFYRKSLVLLADYEQICRESAHIANKVGDTLRVGYLRTYRGDEFQRAIDAFSAAHPQVALHCEIGNHDELFGKLRIGELDVVFNDRRRAFSDEYVNTILATLPLGILVSTRSPLDGLSSVEVGELKNLPCILIASLTEEATEERYFTEVIGIPGSFNRVDNWEAAELAVVSGKGYILCDCKPRQVVNTLHYVPLVRDDRPITQDFCTFSKIVNHNEYIKLFTEQLASYFE